MAEMSFEDFYEVPGLKFDVSRLRDDLNKVLEKKISISRSYTLWCNIIEQNSQR